MDAERRALLANHMEAMSHDRVLVIPFLQEFGDELRRVVRNHLHELSRRDLARDADEVDGLVTDVAFALAERASGWDPAGALPWVWARRAVRAEIVRAIGHARAYVEVGELDGRASGAEDTGEGAGCELVTGDELAVLRGRVGDPRLELLSAAIGEAGMSDRQRDVYVEFRLQKLDGDPSPAETLAPRYGLTSTNVRQIASRAHRRVGIVVRSDERFASLREVRWFAS